MKQIFSIIMAVLILCGNIIPVQAENLTLVSADWAEEHGWMAESADVFTKTIDQVVYQLYPGWNAAEEAGVDPWSWQITTIGSPEAKGSISIPASIDGYPVTSIGRDTFRSNGKITECRIPEGVVVIDDGAFYNCAALTLVELPDSLKQIHSMALYSCPKLTELTIPAAVEKIAYDAFRSNVVTGSGLQKVTFLGNAPEILYHDTMSALEGVDIYINKDAIGWDQECWKNYEIYLIDEIKNEDPEVLSYIDVEKNDWFYDAVTYNKKEGIMTGLDENHFGPYESLARAQFALILYRMTGCPKVEYQEVFHDVEKDAWYADAVIWAYENGIVNGYGNGSFGIEKPITREELLTMLYRYANYAGYTTEADSEFGNETMNFFQDASSVSKYAVSAIEWASGHGIITGKENGTIIDPHGFTARAESAAIVQRFMGNLI